MGSYIHYSKDVMSDTVSTNAIKSVCGVIVWPEIERIPHIYITEKRTLVTCPECLNFLFSTPERRPIGYKSGECSDVVYFIGAENGLTKIGRGNVKQRMASIQTLSPVPVKLTLLGYLPVYNTSKIERELHLMFSSKRKHGEWFDLDDEDLFAIGCLYPGGEWLVP